MCPYYTGSAMCICAYVYISKHSMFMLYHMTLYALCDVFVKQCTDCSTLPEFTVSQFHCKIIMPG